MNSLQVPTLLSKKNLLSFAWQLPLFTLNVHRLWRGLEFTERKKNEHVNTLN